uniref:Ovule protein n=1 Tax=Mesocestoides corti TaxID=53468 RepID=A0A5K3FVH6_MESCO
MHTARKQSHLNFRLCCKKPNLRHGDFKWKHEYVQLTNCDVCAMRKQNRIEVNMSTSRCLD